MSVAKKQQISVTHRLCPHCDKELNMKSYKHHRRLYFDTQSKSWLMGASESQPRASSEAMELLQNCELPQCRASESELPETQPMDVDMLLECAETEDVGAVGSSSDQRGHGHSGTVADESEEPSLGKNIISFT